MLDRRLRETVLFAPNGSLPVQVGDELRLMSRELRAKHLPEEMVVPVPLAMMVEGDDEEVRLLERLQPPRRIGAAEQLVAERAGHAVEDRGSSEELDVSLLQAGKVLAT